jgi:hypothetical protein
MDSRSVVMLLASQILVMEAAAGRQVMQAAALAAIALVCSRRISCWHALLLWT